MPTSRYSDSSTVPQPTRKILPASTDILHPLKMGERIDNLAGKYYQDQTEGWIIMCANPEWTNEFEIPVGTTLRIPFPKRRVFEAWGQNYDI